MIRILREKQERSKYTEITTVYCFCGAIFEATKDEFSREDYFIFPIGGSWHLRCPECGEKHYLYGAAHGQGSREWEYKQIEE